MVESYASSVEDKLIEGLTFRLENGASYINDRRFCTFFLKGVTSTRRLLEPN